MSKPSPKVDADRQLLSDAQDAGTGATLGAYLRLSGPGWLQSAITLGGGSLAGALFLGGLGGTSLLWLQLVAIAMGVIMLSAISYVTLSTGEKPFQAINAHINPVLGWGWLIATCMANMIWCMPQFGLCYAALEKNLIGSSVGDSQNSKLIISVVILAAAFFVVFLNQREGLGAKIFDIFLKALVGMIVLCFFGVVVYLSIHGEVQWGAVLSGFIPDLQQWNGPTGDLKGLVNGLSPNLQEFWTGKIITEQRAVMIGAAATAVGINMTFLLPYSMLNRGWDKPFRGLARFDLSTGMAIPYILVTSCVVIASFASFHAKIDKEFESNDPAVVVTSPLFDGAKKTLSARIEHETGKEAFELLTDDEINAKIAALSIEEKNIGETKRISTIPSVGSTARSAKRKPCLWSGNLWDGLLHDHYLDVDQWLRFLRNDRSTARRRALLHWMFGRRSVRCRVADDLGWGRQTLAGDFDFQFRNDAATNRVHYFLHDDEQLCVDGERKTNRWKNVGLECPDGNFCHRSHHRGWCRNLD
jgi:Mn2+/Fe2+ NRAMP family transporter